MSNQSGTGRGSKIFANKKLDIFDNIYTVGIYRYYAPFVRRKDIGEQRTCISRRINNMATKRTTGKAPLKPSYAYLIEKKRDGHEFTEDEVRNIVDSILDEEMPDFQMAALIMAIFFKDMAAQETAVFARRNDSHRRND